jgi:hypothetical protein
VSPYSNCSKIKRGRAWCFNQTATEKSLDGANYKTLGDEKKKSLGEGFVFISSSRSRVNQKLADIVVCRKTLHSTSKVMRLNERKVPA